MLNLLFLKLVSGGSVLFSATTTLWAVIFSVHSGFFTSSTYLGKITTVTNLDNIKPAVLSQKDLFCALANDVASSPSIKACNLYGFKTPNNKTNLSKADFINQTDKITIDDLNSDSLLKVRLNNQLFGDLNWRSNKAIKFFVRHQNKAVELGELYLEYKFISDEFHGDTNHLVVKLARISFAAADVVGPFECRLYADGHKTIPCELLKFSTPSVRDPETLTYGGFQTLDSLKNIDNYSHIVVKLSQKLENTDIEVIKSKKLNISIWNAKVTKPDNFESLTEEKKKQINNDLNKQIVKIASGYISGSLYSSTENPLGMSDYVLLA